MTKMLSVVATLGIALFSAAHASAAHTKTYMGSACSWTGTTAANRSSHQINNTTAGSLVTSCPVVKDELATTDDITFASASVTGTVTTCRLEMRQETGGLVGWNHDQIINLGGGRSRFEWFPGAGAGNYDPGAALAIACTMPAGTALWSYRLEEL
jgi:hypothetical protein